MACTNWSIGFGSLLHCVHSILYYYLTLDGDVYNLFLWQTRSQLLSWMIGWGYTPAPITDQRKVEAKYRW